MIVIEALLMLASLPLIPLALGSATALLFNFVAAGELVFNPQ
ncbi:hypothetical protein [Kineobactrum salinum]|nr:hypothetical protein [Kineobactrum salinum]